MKTLKILGIYRDPKFSNNAIEADRLILQESIAKVPGVLGSPVQVDFWEEGEVASQTGGSYDLVLTMAQEKSTLDAIERIFPNTPVWNSSAAIRNCYRKTMSQTLIGMPVNYVPFQVVPTDGSVTPALKADGSYWLKRSDFHAICDDDVSLAEGAAEAMAKLAKFRERGVQEVIIQAHIVGDIYKFYGVNGGFFRAIKVRSFLTNAPTPDLAGLKEMAAASAEALSLLVYGGDAILDAQGKFHLIDLNDWPSFRICREDASNAIAALVASHLRSLASARKAPAVSVTC